MFPNRYFNLRYWASRYWPKVGAEPVDPWFPIDKGADEIYSAIAKGDDESYTSRSCPDDEIWTPVPKGKSP